MEGIGRGIAVGPEMVWKAYRSEGGRKVRRVFGGRTTGRGMETGTRMGTGGAEGGLGGVGVSGHREFVEEGEVMKRKRAASDPSRTSRETVEAGAAER